MKAAKLACHLLGSAILGLAPAALATSTTTSTVFAGKHAAFQSGMALFESHNFAAAEAALESGNLQRRGTAGWNVESGAALLKMAIYLRQRDPVATNAALQLALNQFGIAETRFTAATKASDIAVEKQFVGYIYENMLGNRTAALGFYQQASALDPKNAGAAASYGRLKRSIAEEARKH